MTANIIFKIKSYTLTIKQRISEILFRESDLKYVSPQHRIHQDSNCVPPELSPSSDDSCPGCVAPAELD